MAYPTRFRRSVDLDITLLQGLFESREMTSAQIADIYFEGKRETAKRYLRQLKSDGLTVARQRLPNVPAIHTLSKAGLARLRDGGALDRYQTRIVTPGTRIAPVSDRTRAHELAVLDVKAAFHRALAGSAETHLSEFSTWPRLHQFKTDRLVNPDGFLRIRSKLDAREHFFFLELDRSTESLDTLAAKARAYTEYYVSGGFAIRNGCPQASYRHFPFRVLMVFKTAERRNNLLEKLASTYPPVLAQVYAATFDEVRLAPLGPVWVRPVDYRNAMASRMVATGIPEKRQRYKRDSNRDAFIAAQMPKTALLKIDA